MKLVMLNKKIGLLLFVVSCLILFNFHFLQAIAFDFERDSGLTNTGQEAGYNEADLTNITIPQIIGKVVRQLMIYLGVFFMILTIYGGFIWMFSRGNEQEVEKAKKILQNALIGLIVVLLAYAITSLLASALQRYN